MFILKKGHQPGVYVPLRALFLVFYTFLLEFGPLQEHYMCLLNIRFALFVAKNV